MLYIYEIHMDGMQWNTYDLSIDRMPQRREVSQPCMHTQYIALATGLRQFSRVGYLGFLELTGFEGWWVGELSKRPIRAHAGQ